VSGPFPSRRRRTRPAHPDLEPAGDPVVPIGQAVNQLLAARGLREAGSLAEIMAEWQAIVGADVARHVVPSAFRAGELTVDVTTPAWSTEVQFQEALILARCREQLGDGAPAKLRVRVRRPGNMPPAPS
jgi:predicted nucleic acid-binding Zn ribbon protein